MQDENIIAELVDMAYQAVTQPSRACVAQRLFRGAWPLEGTLTEDDGSRCFEHCSSLDCPWFCKPICSTVPARGVCTFDPTRVLHSLTMQEIVVNVCFFL